MDQAELDSLFRSQPPARNSRGRIRDRAPLPEPPPEQGRSRKPRQKVQPWRHFTCVLCADPVKFESGKAWFRHVELHHPELLDADRKLKGEPRASMLFDGRGFAGERHELWSLEETPRRFAIEEKGGPR